MFKPTYVDFTIKIIPHYNTPIYILLQYAVYLGILSSNRHYRHLKP